MGHLNSMYLRVIVNGLMSLNLLKQTLVKRYVYLTYLVSVKQNSSALATLRNTRTLAKDLPFSIKCYLWEQLWAFRHIPTEKLHRDYTLPSQLFTRIQIQNQRSLSHSLMILQHVSALLHHKSSPQTSLLVRLWDRSYPSVRKESTKNACLKVKSGLKISYLVFSTNLMVTLKESHRLLPV